MDEKEEMEAEFRELLKGVAAEEQQELKSMTEGGELGFTMSEDLEAEHTNLLRQSGLNVEQLELQERKDAEATEKWIAEVTPALVMGDEQQLVLQQLAEERGMSLDQSLAGEGIEILTPLAVTVSDSDTLAMEQVGRYRCHGISVLVRGGFQWDGKSLPRRIRRCVDWWYAFKPRWNKFYSIVPRVTYNGFYMVRVPNSFCPMSYVSHFAQVKIDLGVNVYQNGWRGWSQYNVLRVQSSLGGSVYKRFYGTRSVNYDSTRLRNNRWAYIRVRTCLNVYAAGCGSYAKLDFSTGSNQICAHPLYVG